MKRRNFIGQKTVEAGAVSMADMSRRPLKAATRKNASGRTLLSSGKIELSHLAPGAGADRYGSAPPVSEGLRGLPREKVTLLSNTYASTYKETKADLERFRLELNADYIDILPLRCLLDGSWNGRKKDGAMGAGRLRGKAVECLQFALSPDGVGVFTIGNESRAEMEDLVRKIPAASMRG